MREWQIRYGKPVDDVPITESKLYRVPETGSHKLYTMSGTSRRSVLVRAHSVLEHTLCSDIPSVLQGSISGLVDTDQARLLNVKSHRNIPA